MYVYMADEEIKEVPKEERPSFLKEAREERANLEKVRDELRIEIENLKRLKEEDILSGRAPQPKKVEEPEESPQEYLKKVLEGKAGQKKK